MAIKTLTAEEILARDEKWKNVVMSKVFPPMMVLAVCIFCIAAAAKVYPPVALLVIPIVLLQFVISLLILPIFFASSLNRLIYGNKLNKVSSIIEIAVAVLIVIAIYLSVM